MKLPSCKFKLLRCIILMIMFTLLCIPAHAATSSELIDYSGKSITNRAYGARIIYATGNPVPTPIYAAGTSVDGGKIIDNTNSSHSDFWAYSGSWKPQGATYHTDSQTDGVNISGAAGGTTLYSTNDPLQFIVNPRAVQGDISNYTFTINKVGISSCNSDGDVGSWEIYGSMDLNAMYNVNHTSWVLLASGSCTSDQVLYCAGVDSKTCKLFKVKAWKKSKSYIEVATFKAWGSAQVNEIPIAPTNLTAASGDAKVSLSWTAVTRATGYNIKRATVSGGPYTTIATGSSNTYSDESVINGTTYYYVVSALNEFGESKNSNEVSVTTTSPAITLEVASVDKIKLGNEITANIVIHNAKNICAEDMKIAYDTSKLQFIGAYNADGMKIYKENDITSGIKRYITACLGKANAANGDKVLLKLKFKAIDKGEAKIDITNGRIADNATLEKDVEKANCGEKTVLIEGIRDVNKTGEYTLLDLGIDAWYYGDSVANTDTSKYDADQVISGTIDDYDLTEIVAQILNNTNYTANK